MSLGERDTGQHGASGGGGDRDGAERGDVAGVCARSREAHRRRRRGEVLTARNLLPVAWVEPVDVANAVVFLASDEARYITGTQLVVDAGLSEKTT